MSEFPRQYDFRKIEPEVSAFWEREKIPGSTVKFDASRPLFSFLEGPPTANAPPGLHHVQSRFYKDLVCRFNFMKGFSVPRKSGWDCHGLPVEVQVEKKLGLATKKDVLKHGIGKFNRLCREDVFTFIKDWNRMTDRMAFWIDLGEPYITMNNRYIESVWWSLKELYRRNLLYEDHKVVPYCPRCETPLSSHEVALGYDDVTEASVTVKFRLKDEESFILAWTTTPWTLPSNIGLAVGKGMVYAVVEENGVRYIVARDAVSRYFGENPVIVRELAGDDLVGREYIPLFDCFVGRLDRPAWKVIAADFVNADEGTGIVHQAPAFGEEDYDALKREDMAFVQPVDESGKFTSEVPDFEGKFVKDADPEIINSLERDNMLFEKHDNTHAYPFCWRCSSPLIYYALKSWFVRVTAFREKLIEHNQGISWYPPHIRDGRFGDWLANVKDWALSRNKFWGTPLPIWKCDSCGNATAVGSVSELEAAAERDLKGLDLHKPEVDGVAFKCDCGGKMERVPYVIDTWYDSGSAPFAQLHYPFENKELFEKLFPYSFIAESIDQTRGWFYTMHVLGTLLFDSPAYKSVVVGGLLVDEKGEKMSKSKGNTLDPMEVFDAVGVDAVRLQLCSSSPDNTKRFGYELVRENVSPFITTFWNVCVFVDGLKPSDSVSSMRLEDRWVVSRLNQLVKGFTAEFERHNYHRCFEELKWFVVEDLSRWYVRIVRQRDDDAVSDTLLHVVEVLCRLLAPFAPYLSEYVYGNLVRGEAKSVHLAPWPEQGKLDEPLLRGMGLAREVTQSILSVREKIQRSLRWPVSEAVVVGSDSSVQAAVEEFGGIISGQANVRKVSFQEKLAMSRRKLKPDYARLGPVFGSDTPKLIAHVSMRSSEHIARSFSEQGCYELDVDGRKYRLEPSHFIESVELPPDFDSASFSLGSVYVDTRLTPGMEAEGLAREVIRVVQQARKESGLRKTDSVDIAIKLSPEFAEKVSSMESRVREKTGAGRLVISEKEPEGYRLVKAHSVKGSTVEVFFSP